MLEIKIETKDQRISSYAAVGHSKNTCGAITCLARTFVRLACKLPGVQVLTDAPQKGSLFFEVRVSAEPSVTQEYIIALERYSEFVSQAIADLSDEFKDEIVLTIVAGT